MCEELARSPLCLTIPGFGGSGPDHWQTLWERSRHDCERVELGSWGSPSRNSWVSAIERSVRGADAPIIFVAHSLGCHAVAWWAQLMAGEGATGLVVGALLVAPPDVERADSHSLLSRFSPSPRHALPFPSILVASSNDPFASVARSREMAGNWMSDFVEIGEAGHINEASGLGMWREGQALLEQLCDARERKGELREMLRQPAARPPALQVLELS
ncbi:MAG: alpha/beta hydrolase [Sphingomonadaceae bacterium]|nr:alpha/beta hydrolase [Sphingomonadaceae bacterium]